MTSSQSSRIVDAVLRNLNGLSGFDHWWDSIDEDIQQEIRNSLSAALEGLGITSEADVLNAIAYERQRAEHFQTTLQRVQGYIADLGEAGNEGAALLSRRIAEDMT